MGAPRMRWLTGCVVVLVWLSVASGDDGPLPEGALARVGSTRLRQGAQVKSISFAPDGKSFASVGEDGGVCLWAAADGRRIWRVTTKSEEFITKTVRFINGSTIAVLEPDAFRQLDAKTGAETLRHALKPITGGNVVFSADIARDGSRFALGRADGTVEVYNAVTGRLVSSKKVAPQYTSSIVFSPDGQTLATAEGGTTIRVVNAATGEQQFELSGDQTANWKLAFSADGRLLAALGSDQAQSIAIWEVRNRKQLHILKDGPMVFQAIAFSPDSTLLAASGHGGNAPIFDVRQGKVLRAARPSWSPTALAFSPDGRTLACGAHDGYLTLWNTATGERVAGPDPGNTVHELRFSPDGERLLLIADGFSEREWRTGRQIRRRDVDTDRLYSIQLSSDGRLLAAATPDEQIRLADATTGRELRSLSAPGGLGYRTLVSPNGKLIAAPVGRQPLLWVWGTASGEVLHRLDGQHTWGAETMAFSPDSRLLAEASSDASARGDYAIRLWDLEKGVELRRFVPRRGSAFQFAFSPDGKLLAAVGGEPGRGNTTGEVVIWDVATGREVRAFTGHTERITCVQFSADGRMLATGGLDNTVRVWEVASGLERRKFTGHVQSIRALAFSPNGRHLASASADAPVFVWDVYGGPAARWEPERLWLDLADDTAHIAAIRALLTSPEQAVALLRERLKPVIEADSERVKQLLADLDSARFAVREKAAKELEALDVSLSVVQSALEAGGSAEKTQQLKRLLERLTAPNAERLRRTRAVEALERIGTPAARELVAEWAIGATGARLTVEAKETLSRWRKP